jgi:hypothetical protein
MLQIEASDVTDVANEFQGTSDETVEMFIALARRFVSESQWGDMSKQGIVQMAAHLLKKAGYGYGSDNTGTGGGVATGPVISESVGEISRTYANVGSSGSTVADALLATTSYGQLFLMMRSTLVRTPFVV